MNTNYTKFRCQTNSFITGLKNKILIAGCFETQPQMLRDKIVINHKRKDPNRCNAICIHFWQIEWPEHDAQTLKY